LRYLPAGFGSGALELGPKLRLSHCDTFLLEVAPDEAALFRNWNSPADL